MSEEVLDIKRTYEIQVRGQVFIHTSRNITMCETFLALYDGENYKEDIVFFTTENYTILKVC